MKPATKLNAQGLFHAVSAYSLWGLVPLFWRQIPQYSATELLSHRVVWSLVFYALAIRALRLPWPPFRLSRETLLLTASSVLIATNWILYIYAVQAHQVIQGSLAYFITPLLNVAIGAVIFKEKLSWPMRASLLVAAVGVIVLLIEAGSRLEIAALLALTFAGYGVCKRKIKMPPLQSNLTEAALLFPMALVVLVLHRGGIFEAPGAGGLEWILLMASGLVTALPLLLFSSAAQKIPFTVLGVCQFLSPTLQFALAVFVFDEPFRMGQMIGFAIIWMALIFYVMALRRQTQSNRPRAA